MVLVLMAHPAGKGMIMKRLIIITIVAAMNVLALAVIWKSPSVSSIPSTRGSVNCKVESTNQGEHEQNQLVTSNVVSNSQSANGVVKDARMKEPSGPITGARDGCDSDNTQNREPPYGKFCETRPRVEKQPWNTRKKVISFSLFLPHDKKGEPIPGEYLEGLEANLRLSSLYFPDWIVRVYVLNLSEEQIESVIMMNDKCLEVVRCHDSSPLLNSKSSARSMFSRFLVLDDPTVEYAMIRDLDSRPSIRELLAVNEWISSGMSFHGMRDHAYHSVPIMGGMWGAKHGAIDMTSTIERAFKDFPNSGVPGCCADDQNFLAMYVWPIVKGNAIDHDMDHGRCRMYGAKVCRKFPMTNRDDAHIFVGLPFKDPQGTYVGGKNAHYECSVDCKPSHDEWYTDPSASNI